MIIGKNPDVLIIGGGPVGSRVASQIAKAGYDTLVLEQKASLETLVCCTALISGECLKRFEFTRGLILRSFCAASVFSPKGNKIDVRREKDQAYALNRPGLDKELFLTAAGNGARYLFNHQVTDLKITRDCITAEVNNGGRIEHISARTAVLASGFGSRLFNSLGLKRGTGWAMGIQANAVTTDATNVEIYSGHTFAPGFFAWLVPTLPGHAHVGLMSRRNTRRHFDRFLLHLHEKGIIKSSTAPVLRGITLSPPSKTCGDRFILVGDCAGQVKPISGGGLYFGLLSADVASRHLLASLRNNDLSARAFSAYSREWRNLLGNELRLGHYARKAYSFLSDRQIEFLFTLIKRYRLPERLARSEDIGFDWHGAAITRVCGFLNPLSMKE